MKEDRLSHLTKWLTNLRDKLDALGKRLSEEGLIAVDHKVLVLCGAAFLLFGILSALRIHTSSVGIWDIVITGNTSPPRGNVLLGTPRGVRADEWMIETPLFLSQASRDFPVENRSYGFGKSTLITSYAGLPLKHYTAFFRPQCWPFFVFNFETAFSVYWNLRIFGFIVSLFALLMLLSRNAFWLSLSGSIWLFFSGQVQWWWGIFTTDHLTAMAVMSVSALYILFAKRKTLVLTGALFFMISAANLGLVVYPASQISIGYLFLFVLVGYILANRRAESLRTNIGFKTVAAVLALMVPGLVLLGFLHEVRETTAVLLATEYPGRRMQSSSGGVSWKFYFSGLFSVFFGETRYPQTNICECMTFLPLWPIVSWWFAKSILVRKKVDWLLASLLACISLFTILMCVGLPAVLTRVTLLNKAYGTRPCFALCAANVFLCVRFLSHRDRDGKSESWGRLLSAAGVLALTVVGLGMWWSRAHQNFLTPKEILLAGIVVGSIGAALAMRRTRLFFIGVLGWVLVEGATVNPISMGLSPLFDKDLSKLVSRIQREDPHGRWAAFGDNYAANFIKGLGAEVFNGVRYVPDLQEMSVLDPQGKYRPYYNRYAHIEMHLRMDDDVSFDKASSYPLHDHISIFVNPASPKLASLGISYIVIPARQMGQPDYFDEAYGNSHGLTKIVSRPVNGYWVWTRKRNVARAEQSAVVAP